MQPVSTANGPTIAPATLAPRPPATAEPDPHAWLEEVHGDAALAWVRARNQETATWAQGADFEQLERELRAVLDADGRIPYVSQRGAHVVNFWKDAAHPRGLWRRTSLASYRTPTPDWQVLLDLDALGQQEGVNWVFAGATYLRPEHRRCMVALSRGGADAHVIREFDTVNRAFVGDGFTLPEAKSSLSWLDRDTLLVATELGDDSLTTSGYPRQIRRWRRGTPLSAAPVIFAGETTDVSVSAWHDPTPGFERTFVARAPTFFTLQCTWLDDSGTPRPILVPADARHWVHREWLCVHLRSDWAPADVAYPADSLLAIGFDAFMAGERVFQILFTPTPGTCLEDISWTRNHLILKTLEHVKARLQVLTPQPAGPWTCMPLAGAPAIGSATVLPCDPESNAFFLAVEDFLTPTALLYGQIGEAPAVLKTMPTFFNAGGLQIEQHFATSADGTRVPYFQVGPAGLTLDGSHRTLLDGYGGFEVSLLPSYSGSLGRGWLAAGGVYVLANIRGGGEYGPLWHQAAVRANRPRAYEDFAAVADDLVARAVTQRARLGITGGSNGGLLVGNMLTQYPDRVGAIVCRVPLLDMRRYVHLLAGASWMGEYGDPEQPEDWAFLRTFSPYHGLRQGQAYPPTLFTTSTRDDRVHPAHARKMMAKMRSMGCEVHYYENIEGGHGGAADNAQAAYMTALGYAFLRTHLASDPAAQRPKP